METSNTSSTEPNVSVTEQVMAQIIAREEGGEIAIVFAEIERAIRSSDDEAEIVEALGLLFDAPFAEAEKGRVRRLVDAQSQRFAPSPLIWRGYARFVREHGESAELLAALEVQVELETDGGIQASLLEEMGDMAKADLRRPQDALLFYRTAADRKVTAVTALRKAAQLYLDDGLFPPAFALLKREYEVSRDNDELSPAPDLIDSLVAVGEALVAFPKEHAVAKEALELALILSPSNEQATGLVGEIETFGEHWKEHIRKLRDQALDTRDKKQVAAKYLAIAQIYRVYAPEEPKQMQDTLNTCFLVAPGYAPALKFYEDVHRDGARVAEFIDWLKTHAGGIRNVEIASKIWTRVAMLLAEQGAPVDERVAAYEEIRRIDPRNQMSTTALTELFLEARQFNSAAEVMEDFLGETSDSEAKRRTLLMLARIYEGELDDPAKAAEKLEAYVALAGTENVLNNLVELYGRTENEQRLAETYERILRDPATTDDKARTRLLEPLLSLYQGPLAEPEKAFAAAKRLFSIAPREALEEELLRLADALARPGELAEGYLAAAEATADDETVRRDYRMKAARAYVTGGDGRRGREILKSILAADPHHQAATELLDTILEREADPEELVAVLEERFKSQTEPQDQVRTLLMLADGYDRMRRPRWAIERLQSVLKLVPHHPGALERLDGLYQADEDFANLAETLEQRIAASEAEHATGEQKNQRFDHMRRLARLYDERLGEPERAADLYLSLYEHTPENADVLRALERLIDRGVRRVAIAEVLQPYYAQVKAFRRQTEMLAIRRDAETEPSRRAALSRAMAVTFIERVGSSREAFDALAEALVDEPSTGAEVRELETLAEECGAHAAFADVLVRVADKLPEGPGKNALLSRRASLLQGVLGDRAAAIEAHEQLLQKTPGHLPTLDALCDLYEQQENHEAFCTTLERRLAESPPEEVAQLAARLGATRLQHLKDGDGAEEPLRTAVFGELPLEGQKRKGPLALLVGLYRERGEGEYEKLAEALSAYGECLAGAERVAVRVEEGDVLSTRLARFDEALDAYEAALANDPNAGGAIDGVRFIVDAEGVEESLRRTAARTLAERYAALDQHEGRAHVLSVLESMEADPAGKRRLFHERVSLVSGELEDPDGAVNMLVAHLEQDPLDEQARDRLEALAGALSMTLQVTALYSRLREHDDDGIRRVYADRLAGMLERSGDAASAVEALSFVLDLDPERVDAWERLRAVYDRANDGIGVARCLEALAQLAEGPAKVTRYMVLADYCFEVLEDPDRGIDALVAAQNIIPDDDTVLLRLHEKLREHNRPAELIGVLDLRAQLAPHDGAMALLYLEQAEVHFTLLQENAAAVVALKRSLAAERDGNASDRVTQMLYEIAQAEDEAGLEALEAVIDHHRSGQAWHPLVEALEVAALRRSAGAERAKTYDEIAKLQEEAVRAPQLAFVAACHALREDTTDGRIQRVRELAEQTSAWTDLLGILEDVAERQAETDAESSVRLYREVVDLASRIADVESQTRAAEAILILTPGDAEALTLLERIHRSHADQAQLMGILEQRVQSATDPAEKRGALMEWAALLVDQAAEDDAERVYKDALGLNPEDEEVLVALDNLYARTGESQSHIDIIERRIAIGAEPGFLAEQHVRVSLLRLTRRGDPAGATDALTAALGIMPGHPQVRQGLETLVAHAREHGVPPLTEAAALLEQAIRAQGDHTAVVQVIELQLSQTQDRARRAELLRAMAQVQEVDLAAPPTAFNTLCRALNELPTSTEVRMDAERLAKQSETEDVLASVYEELLDQIDDVALRITLSLRMAEIAEQDGDRDEAKTRVRAAVEMGADDLEILKKLLELTRGSATELELADVLFRVGSGAEAAEDVPLAVDAWAELSSVYENADELSRAVAAAERVVALAPEDMEARTELSRLLRRGGRTEELEQQLVGAVDVAQTPEKKAELLARLGVVRLDDLGDTEGAVSALEAIDNVNPAAHEIVPLGAQILTKIHGESGDDSVQARARAARVLKPRYEAQQAWRELVAVLGYELEATTDADERKALWLRVIEIYEYGLELPEQTFLQAGRALSEDPADEELRLRVERISMRLGDLETVAALYEDILDSLNADPQLQARYARRTGELYAFSVGELGAAAKFFEMALAHYVANPADDPDAQAAILEQLESIYRTTTDAQNLAHTLKRRADVFVDEAPEDARRMYYEAAAMERASGDMGAAIDTLKRLLAASPDDLQALSLLGDAAREQGRFQELAESLERQLAIVSEHDAERSLDVRHELAVVLHRDLELVDDANLHFQAILEENPSHADTREYLHAHMSGEGGDGADLLEDAYEKTGDWSNALQVLEARLRDAESRGDRSQAKDLYLKIATIQQTHLDSPELAFLKLTLALKHDPADKRICTALEEVGTITEQLDDVCEVYEDNALEAEEAGRASVAADLRESAARLFAGPLDQPEAAVTILEAILETQPGRTEALAALTDLYLRTGRWEDHEKILRRRLMFQDEARGRAALLIPLAQTVADHLDRPEDAISLVLEARRLVPHHKEARRLLIDLSAVEGESDDLRALLEEEVEFCRKAEDRENLHVYRRRLATLLGNEIGDVEAAVPLWQEIRAEASDDRTAFDALRRLLERSEAWDEVRALYEEELANERDPTRNSELQQQLSDVLAEHLGGADEAISRHLEVLKFEPRNETSLNALRRLYRNTGQHDELVTLLRKMMRSVTVPQELKTLRFELAEALGEHLGKRAEAVETGRYILDIEPHTPAELSRLADVFRKNGAFQEVAHVIERQVAMLEGEEKVVSLRALATVFEEDLERPDAAAPAYSQILTIDPSDDLAYAKICAIYERTAAFKQLIAVKEARIPFVESATEKVSLLRDIGRINEEQLGDKMFAFMAASRAFQANFDDDDIATWMDRLGIQTDMVDTVIEYYDDALAFVTDEARIIAIHLRIAQLAGEHLADVEQAELHLKRALEYDAENGEAIDALVKLYQKNERWDDAVFYLERKADTADDNEARTSVMRRAARLLSDSAHNVDAALAEYKRILEIAPSDDETLREYAALLEQAERWPVLITVLERQEELAPTPAEALAFKMRSASVWEQQLGNLEQAAVVYEAVGEQAEDPAVALKALERLYTTLGESEKLIGVFERMLANEVDGAQRIRLLTKIGSTYEDSIDAPDHAIEAADRILIIDEENVQGLATLARLLRKTERWDRLIDAHQRMINVIRDPEEITKLYIEMGNIYHKELGDASKAESYFLAALDHNPESKSATAELSQLYERSGNWFNALEKLRQGAELAGSNPEAVDMHYRMGRINEEMLLDVGAAKEAYGRALDIQPDHVPSLQALKEIALNEKDSEGYLSWLRTEAKYTKDEYVQTELYTAAGVYLQEERSDLAAAAEEFERALALTYDYLPAAEPLSDICFRNEQWPRAEALYEIIVEQLDSGEDAEALVRHHYRLGYVCEKLEKDTKALRHYQQGYDIDATYLPILEGLGAALAKSGRHDDAAKIYQAILIHHRSELTEAEVVDYYQQLASMQFAENHGERAQRNLEKALELDANHGPSLRLLADIYRRGGQEEDAYETLFALSRQLLGEDKAEVLIEIGELSRNELEDEYRAIDAFAEAAKVDPQNAKVLESLFDLYRQTAQGQQAVEVLEELVGIEPDEKARVRLNHLLGETYRDDLNADARAIQYFNAALDLDPSFIKAFEAVETLLSQRQNWPALEQNYIGMIRRIPEDQSGIKMVLWRNLGDLYRYKLNNAAGAVSAYKVLHRGDPNNVDVLENLAVMLASAGQVDEAIGAYQQVIPLAKERQKAVLHQLLRLYLNRGHADRAFMACAALSVHQDLSGEEQQLYVHYQKRRAPRATRAMTEPLWEEGLLHPAARGPLAVVSRQIWRAAGGLLLQDKKALGLDKRRQWTALDLDAPVPHYFTTQFKYVRDVLAVGPVSLFVKRQGTEPVHVLPTSQPTIAVGEGNEEFREMPQRLLWFVMARQLAYLRPEFLLARAVGPAAFQAILEAALSLIEPRYPIQSDQALVGRYRQEFQRVGPAFIGAVRVPLQNLLATGQRPDIAGYLRAMEHTAIRAAFLLSGDLEVSAQSLRKPDVGPLPLPYGDKLRDLLDFSVSDANFGLREKLGIAVVAQ